MGWYFDIARTLILREGTSKTESWRGLKKGQHINPHVMLEHGPTLSEQLMVAMVL